MNAVKARDIYTHIYHKLNCYLFLSANGRHGNAHEDSELPYTDLSKVSIGDLARFGLSGVYVKKIVFSSSKYL
jgi:hypothetical protein